MTPHQLKKQLWRNTTIGGDYASRELKGILKEFLREQAFVKAEGRTVHVTFYGHRHENVLRSLFSDLNKRLTEKRIDGRVPWLGYWKLEFHFNWKKSRKKVLPDREHVVV